jgi:copper oxidase (laccase) domain-containing protein
VVVDGPGHAAGAAADAAVTAAAGAALVVRTADCAPVALLADEAVGIVHAGWRGLLLGVVEAAVAAVRDLGAGSLRAAVGPCIAGERYEFGVADLDLLAGRYGDSVRARTGAGRPALDLAAGVDAALRAAGVEMIERHGACTAAEPERWFSHRARRDRGRQGTFVWLDAGPGGSEDVADHSGGRGSYGDQEER